MKLGRHLIGPGQKPFIIAEIAQSHDGSFGQAMAFIDIAADCGADAVKFQTHIAEEESTPQEPWRIKFSHQDSTRYDYWKRMSFDKNLWIKLKKHAEKKKLVFLSSPFSEMAVNWLNDIGIKAWKIASGEVHNENLLDCVESTSKPVILSSGLSDFSHSKKLIKRFKSKNIQVALLHCTTMYPTPPEEIGMNIFEDMKKNLPSYLPIGLSDHSGTIIPSIIATYLGASIIEVHLTMHNKMFGPDVSSSLNPKKFSELVKAVNFAFRMSQSKVKKSDQLSNLNKIKSIFGRSLVFNKNLNLGHVIKKDDIIYKKPGGGLSYENLKFFLGKKLTKNVLKNKELKFTDVKVFKK
tara:strand:- start:466 stop:1518 length:1053 start_codon:yes stop_codon:yes gene_type:complete